MKKQILAISASLLISLSLLSGCGASENAENESTPESSEEYPRPEEITARYLLDRFFEERFAAPISFTGEVFSHYSVTNPDTQEKTMAEIAFEFENNGVNDHYHGTMRQGDTLINKYDYYSITDPDGQATVYYLDPSSSEWLKNDAVDYPVTSAAYIPDFADEYLTLEETENRYTVTGTVKGDLFFSAVDLRNCGLFAPLYNQYLTDDVYVYYVFDKDSLHLSSFEVDMTDAAKESFLDLWESQGLDRNVMSASSEIYDYGMSITDITYGPGTPIELPPEVENARWSDGRPNTVAGIELADSFDFNKEEYKHFSFNGHEYDLEALILQDLLTDHDLTVPDDQQGEILGSGEFDSLVIAFGTHDCIVADVTNTTSGDLPVEECTVTGFVYDYNEPVDYRIAGIGPDAVLDDLMERFGNPTSAYDHEFMHEYLWEGDDGYIEFDYYPENEQLCGAGVFLY